MALEIFSSTKNIIGFVSVAIFIIGIIIALIILAIKYKEKERNSTNPNDKIL
jgi:hypothetical protein